MLIVLTEIQESNLKVVRFSHRNWSVDVFVRSFLRSCEFAMNHFETKNCGIPCRGGWFPVIKDPEKAINPDTIQQEEQSLNPYPRHPSSSSNDTSSYWPIMEKFPIKPDASLFGRRSPDEPFLVYDLVNSVPEGMATVLWPSLPLKKIEDHECAHGAKQWVFLEQSPAAENGKSCTFPKQGDRFEEPCKLGRERAGLSADRIRFRPVSDQCRMSDFWTVYVTVLFRLCTVHVIVSCPMHSHVACTVSCRMHSVMNFSDRNSGKQSESGSILVRKQLR